MLYRWIIVGCAGWFFFLSPMANDALAFTESEQESQLARLIAESKEQNRTELVYSSTLNFVARYRAEEMARLNYADHVNPDGFGPNVILWFAGYELPLYYLPSKEANFVESLTAGHATAKSAFSAFMGSPGHKDHLMARDQFYLSQTRYGIGYASSNREPYRHFWVVITAPPAPDEEIRPFKEWKFEHLSLNQMLEGKIDHDGDGMALIQEYIHDFDPNLVEAPPVMKIEIDPITSQTLLRWPLRTNMDPLIEVIVETADLNLIDSPKWKQVEFQRQREGLAVGKPMGQQGAYRIRVLAHSERPPSD
ncbi:MAG: CAP domain-containing protein [Verrucomicrobiota bacterium]|nr:CAP domain-containing protein [Verrucomicrobiota bacterium]